MMYHHCAPLMMLYGFRVVVLKSAIEEEIMNILSMVTNEIVSGIIIKYNRVSYIRNKFKDVLFIR